MSPWLFLAAFLIFLGFIVRRHDQQQLIADLGPDYGIDNKEALTRSLDALISFLSMQGQPEWAGRLRDIQIRLRNADTEAEGLARLSDLFGGMGSLNDVVFEPSAYDTGSRLLDAAFRDMKLYHGTPADRAEWRKLEVEHQGELPPRIKHAFRQE